MKAIQAACPISERDINFLETANMLEQGSHEIDGIKRSVTEEISEKKAIKYEGEEETDDGPIIEDEADFQARMKKEQESHVDDYEVNAINQKQSVN